MQECSYQMIHWAQPPHILTVIISSIYDLTGSSVLYEPPSVVRVSSTSTWTKKSATTFYLITVWCSGWEVSTLLSSHIAQWRWRGRGSWSLLVRSDHLPTPPQSSSAWSDLSCYQAISSPSTGLDCAVWHHMSLTTIVHTMLKLRLNHVLSSRGFKAVGHLWIIMITHCLCMALRDLPSGFFFK